jgi:anthranilate synthase component 1
MQELIKKPGHDIFSFEEIQRRKKRPLEIVPVVEAVNADITPLEAYLKLKRPGYYSFLFESAALGGKTAKYSFIGSSPRIISIKDGSISINGKDIANINPLSLLKDIMSGFKPLKPLFIREDSFSKDTIVMPGFYGGLAGYISYDFIRYIDSIGNTASDDLGCPDAELIFVDDMIAFDHGSGHILLISNAFLNSSGRDDSIFDARLRVKAMKASLYKTMAPLPETGEQKSLDVKYSMSKENFMEMVKRAKEYILDGDSFQVVLSQRAEISDDIDHVRLYSSLKKINPSPYMYFLEFGDTAIAGSSPEILVRVEGRKAIVRPIAGTRPRGINEEDDKKLEEEMSSDPKELAEHVMLVDLGRNDLGKVSKFGSVKVDNYMGVEKYSHVQHIVSNVTGELEDDKGPIDVLAATFPAGTVSGAPKTRSMQIIEELEGRRRGLYAGCVGYICFNGNTDLAIAIRTILLKNKKAYVQAGAGIVMDSDPEKEYFESMNKAAAMLKAISMSKKGGV